MYGVDNFDNEEIIVDQTKINDNGDTDIVEVHKVNKVIGSKCDKLQEK